MTPATLLNELKNQGVILEPRGDKLRFGPKEKVTPELRDRIVKHKADLLAMLQPDSALAEAYRRYWTTPEDASMDTFRSILAEIATLEAQADPQVSWRTLRESATAWHTETAICPFCRQAGELHLPEPTLEAEMKKR